MFGIKNPLYSLAVVLVLGFGSLMSLIILVKLSEIGARKRNHNRKTAAHQPWQQSIQYDEEDEDEVGYREEGWEKEEYEPIIRRVINPVKKRVILSNGTLDYKPVGELKLPQAALNVLVAIFPYPEPEPLKKGDITPEQ
ncbi:MAG: hypothetical protein AAB738_02100 [Patescibacteria group bacterium]